ncbi:DUF982 domain-containing protein [Rhizobium sp. BK251]|uniref:DUF982 domain-containing protein n=1 Tax=Rhizobium sp. BK251 TaxID=2512125 RepID=UPI0010464F32|nr:DUF982 domain-containing protein [Rhizobium sp. BK251]TCL63664.1 uncharacterized protein DUF982 [Rhizobium sp. BK251]
MGTLVLGKPWNTPVAIEIQSGRMRSVSNTGEAAGELPITGRLPGKTRAAEGLLNRWPVHEGQAYEAAGDILLGAMNGRYTQESARSALIVAAE